MMKKNKSLFIAISAVALLAFGCKKSYLNTAPQDKVTDENLYTTVEGCRQVLDGMAVLMSTSNSAFSMDGNAAARDDRDFGQKSLDLGEDVMGADVICSGNGYDWFDNYHKWTGPSTPGSRESTTAWYFYYKLINASNLLLANIDKVVGGNAEEVAEIKGEAYAYRAYAYYKLSIYYCKTYSLGLSNPGVPIYTTPTTSETKGNPRGTVGDTYKRIITDIDSAVNLIANSGVTPDNKSYISLATAYGIYAEIALVMRDWVNAEKYADLAINNAGGASALMSTDDYKNSGFRSASNSEWMWASQLTNQQTPLLASFMSFVDANNPGSYAGGGGTFRKIPLYLFSKIAAGDVRKACFDNTRKQRKFYQVDYSTWSYDVLYMRIAEMFLIKAEAQAQNGGDAVTTLETLVQKRYPAYTYAGSAYFTGTVPPGSTKLLEEIYLQRRIELYLEGKSFSDLKRLQRALDRPTGTGNFDPAICKVLHVDANSNQFLFKISQVEMDNNKSFTSADQNP